VSAKASNPNTHSTGVTTRQVTISSITPDGSTAVCIDKTGVEVRVPMYWQPGKGQPPAVGENWILTQDLGQWAFSMIVASTATPFNTASYKNLGVTGTLTAPDGSAWGTSGPSFTKGFILQNQSAPATPTAGPVVFGSGGNQQYKGTDGNVYNTGRASVATTAAQTIVSTSYVTAGSPGLSLPVAAAAYRFRFHIWFVPNSTGTAGNAAFRLQGPAFTTGSYAGDFAGNGTTGIVRFDNTSGFNVVLTGPALTASSSIFYRGDIEGRCVFTSAGTLLLQAALSSSGTTEFVIAQQSFLELFPG
jgi:hypothetical protein